MTDNTVTPLVHPGEFTDMLTDVLRTGARQLLAQAVEAEVECFIEEYADHRLEDGRARIVRYGSNNPGSEIGAGLRVIGSSIHPIFYQIRAPHKELGSGFTGVVFEGNFFWQLPRCLICIAGAGSAEPIFGYGFAIAP